MMRRSFSELLNVRKDAELAGRGAEVLEKMENALTKDLRDLQSRISTLQEEISSLMDEISALLESAKKASVLVDIEGLIGSEPLDNVVEPGTKKKFGKLIMEVQPVSPKETEPRWGASFDYEKAHSTSKRLLAKLVELADAQTEEEFVQGELAKTRRRVNALRRIILPDLDKRRKSLEEWMDEETREELGRRRWVEKVVG